MQRSSTTTGLIVEASHVLHETVGVLSDRKCGAAVHAVGTATRKVALWRTRVASSSSEFVIVTLRFVDKTKYAMVSSGRV